MSEPEQRQDAEEEPLPREAYVAYERLKRAWADIHPSATPSEYFRAIQRIADEVGI